MENILSTLSSLIGTIIGGIIAFFTTYNMFSRQRKLNEIDKIIEIIIDLIEFSRDGLFICDNGKNDVEYRKKIVKFKYQFNLTSSDSKLIDNFIFRKTRDNIFRLLPYKRMNSIEVLFKEAINPTKFNPYNGQTLNQKKPHPDLYDYAKLLHESLKTLENLSKERENIEKIFKKISLRK